MNIEDLDEYKQKEQKEQQKENVFAKHLCLWHVVEIINRCIVDKLNNMTHQNC